jgi:hypothetical protein
LRRNGRDQVLTLTLGCHYRRFHPVRITAMNGANSLIGEREDARSM